MENSVQDDKKAVMPQEHDIDSSVSTSTVFAGVEPEVAAIIATLTPERRAEIEKRVKLKIDCFLFPMLLIFYILNYLVRRRLLDNFC